MENAAKRNVMRRYVLFSALALSVTAGSLATATPAHATLWRNFKSSNGDTPLYLSGDGINQGTGLTLAPFSGLNSIIWSRSPDPIGSGYWRLLPAQPPLSPPVVAGVAGGAMRLGTPVVTGVANGNLEQHWLPGPSIYDNNGALCYVFFNRKDMSMVLGVSWGVMAVNQPVNIWKYHADVAGDFGDQAWCAYTIDANGNAIPETPPPF